MSIPYGMEHWHGYIHRATNNEIRAARSNVENKYLTVDRTGNVRMIPAHEFEKEYERADT